MNGKWNVIAVALLVVGLSLTGCVEEEASVVMHSNLLGDGTFDTGDEDEPDRVGCTFTADFDEPRVLGSGTIDLAELENEGQRMVRESNQGANLERYTFTTVLENRLADSRTVGAVSGGDGDGFENLELDKNDVMITSGVVDLFAVDDGALVGVFDQPIERRSTMLVQSGGGVANYGVPIIQGFEEIQRLREGVGADPVSFIAEIQLMGETLAGDQVESNTVEYPITICDGCGGDDIPYTNPMCEIDG